MLDIFHVTDVLGGFSNAEISIAAAVLLVASVVRGITGFGFSAIIVTGLTFILPPAETVVLALLLEIVASVHLLPAAWKNIEWPLLGTLCIGIVVGTPIGVSLLAWLDPDVMRIVISCLVLCFALLILLGYTYMGPRTVAVHSGLGLVSGVCNGTAALGGLPVVTFLLSTRTTVAATRATLIAAFFATDVYALVFAGAHGIVTRPVIGYWAFALPVLVLGVAAGQRLFHIVSPVLFKKLALFLLLGLSSTGIARGILQLM